MAVTSSPKPGAPARGHRRRTSPGPAEPLPPVPPPAADAPAADAPAAGDGGGAGGDASTSIDPRQAAIFGALASDWWDPDGRSRLLHRINPARLGYVRSSCDAHFGWDPRAVRPAAGLTALDVGCGGGLLTEPLARMGFAVTGLDAAPESISVARDHAAAAGLAIDYRQGSAEALAAERPGAFDLVTSMEVVEHVADVAAFLAALRALLKPGGLFIFSTPNRTALSFAVLIVGAERVTRDIPVGAHDWRRFLTPPELSAALGAAGFTGVETVGLGWRPGRGFVVGGDKSINYLGRALPA